MWESEHIDRNIILWALHIAIVATIAGWGVGCFTAVVTLIASEA